MLGLQKTESDIKNIIIFSKDGFPIYRGKALKNADFCNVSGFFSVISMYMDHMSKSDFYSIQTDTNLIAFRKCFEGDIIISIIAEQDIKKKKLRAKLDKIDRIVYKTIDKETFLQKKEEKATYRHLGSEIRDIFRKNIAK